MKRRESVESKSSKERSVLIHLLSILVFLFYASLANGQDLTWAKRAGGDSSASSSDIAVDVSGYSYVTGRFQGSATFGVGEVNETTLSNAGFVDIFIAKYDVEGILCWAKQAGGSEEDAGFGIAVDASGNSHVIGLFVGLATFGAGQANETILTSSGSRDIFIAKYNGNGMLLWVERAGGSDSNDHGVAIAVDAFYNGYVTGYFNTSITFGAGTENETTLISAGLFDVFTAKYNADGLLLWAKAAGAGGETFDAGSGISVDASGNSCVTGGFEGSATFGESEVNKTTLTSSGSQDIFVAKYNADGLLLWVKPAGGSDGDRGRAIAVDASDNSYVTGAFEGSATFGVGETNETTLISVGSRDIFVAKHNADGLLLWAKRAGGSSSNSITGDSGVGIGLDASGNSYVTGPFEGAATFGADETNETILISAGANDIFVAKYSPDGLLLWAKRAGGRSNDFSSGIGIDASGNSYVTGGFEGSATFGNGETNETTLNSAGASDIFVAKYGAGSPTRVDEISILIDDFKLTQNYPNPFNPATTISYDLPEAGHVTVSIYDILGQKIRTLLDESQKSGSHRLQWDGTNNDGIKVTSGVYYYRVDAGDKRVVKSMLLVK